VPLDPAYKAGLAGHLPVILINHKEFHFKNQLHFKKIPSNQRIDGTKKLPDEFIIFSK